MWFYTHTYIYNFWKYGLDFQTVVVFKDKIKCALTIKHY